MQFMVVHPLTHTKHLYHLGSVDLQSDSLFRMESFNLLSTAHHVNIQ